MTFGNTIGKKFHEDGSVRRYPGNTVVANVLPGNPGYEAMSALRRMVVESGFHRDWILLPEDSYHMTVIRGLNDQVRTEGFWPPALPKDLPFEAVDDYVTAAVNSVAMPGRIPMRFTTVHVGGAVTVGLLPADEAVAARLSAFRDAVADAIGLRLPRHDTYRFHISLAYVRVVAENSRAEEQKAMLERMDSFLKEQPIFETEPPFMAYYDDMLYFSPRRIPR